MTSECASLSGVTFHDFSETQLMQDLEQWPFSFGNCDSKLGQQSHSAQFRSTTFEVIRQSWVLSNNGFMWLYEARSDVGHLVI